MSTNVTATISDAGNPQDGAFQLVSQVRSQVKTSKTRRNRKPRPRRINVEQLALLGLVPSGDENTT